MRLGWTRTMIVILAMGTFGARHSFACSCVIGPGTSNCRDLNTVPPSFVGTVIDIENPPDDRAGADESGLSRYRFRIDENISGFEQKEVDIYSGRGDSDCSYHFEVGETYFVAPVREVRSAGMNSDKAPNSKLMAWMCGLTQHVAGAGALPEELRPHKTGATIVGVLRTEPGSDDYNHRIPNATLQLRSGSATLSTQTDMGGVYRFDEVPTGEYQFTVKLPPEFQVAADSKAVLPSIMIGDQPCYQKDIYMLRTAQTGAP